MTIYTNSICSTSNTIYCFALPSEMNINKNIGKLYIVEKRTKSLAICMVLFYNVRTFISEGFLVEFGKCVVVREDLTAEDIIRIRNSQENTSTQNCRDGEESAFSKALRGSKLYLKAQGYISDSEE